MNCLLKVITPTLGALIASSVLSASAANLAIVLSPNGNPAAKKAEVIDILKLMTQAVEPGDTATIFNGLTGRSLCTFAVPNRRSYSSAKAKINVNGACVGQLMHFAKNSDASGVQGVLDVPGVLRILAESLDMAEIDAILIFGSPIYDDPREPSVSMRNGDVPSDGHIIAARADSPYGMAGLKGRLQGTPVHISSDGYDWARNNRHETSVHRFWWLAVETLGGTLATFNADRAQMIGRVARGVETTAVTYERSASKKREMIHIALDAGGLMPIHERMLTTSPLAQAERRRALDVEIGINWACECDLDIYVRPFPTAEIIYYGNRRTNEGQFYRDYRNGRELLNGLESVSFDAPVDLEKMVVAVNFYSGHAPKGVTGEIRIAIGTKTYAMPFEIAATTGNEGQCSEEAFRDLAAPNDRWVVTTGLKVVSER